MVPYVEKMIHMREEGVRKNEYNTKQESWLSEGRRTGATRRRRFHCQTGCCCCSKSIPAVTGQIRAPTGSSLIGSLTLHTKRQTRCHVINTRSGTLVMLLLLLLSGPAMSQDAPLQTPSPSPDVNRTTAPTGAAVVTMEPTLQPTISASPSSVPTRPATLRPSDKPSAMPSISLLPTISPAPSTSDQPSGVPSFSMQPSSLPSSALPQRSLGRFRQNYVIQQNSTFFNETEKVELSNLFESYTDEFAVHDLERIDTRCTVNDQKIFTDPGADGQGPRQILTLDYRCAYLSSFVSTDEYPSLFEDYVNSDLPSVTLDVQNISQNVIEALTVFQTVADSPAPTFSMIPSAVPSPAPTFSVMPSSMPSSVPTSMPTPERFPTTQPSVSSQPTNYPTSVPTLTPGDDDGASVGLIAGLVIALGLAGLGGLVVFYRRSKQSRATRVTGTSAVASSDGTRRPSSVIRSSRTGVDYGGDTIPDAGVVILPSDSLVSNKSFLSAGDDGMGDDSGDEADGTKNLQDEFDQYKDQTLEQFRSNIEGNLTGFEGIMSAAVTKALMGDDDENVDDRELLWGCEPGANGAEIEASALCEVSDWIKRNETAPSERKRVFMKEVLNRMVTSVRLGAMHANDGARTIHECAALLGLPLKHELPMTTVIFSGMRKTVGANEMMKVLREFGEIDVCAVASGQRGFGIVRFRNTKSVDRAMRRYRGGEIVVQDVAIQMKVLNPSGVVEG